MKKILFLAIIGSAFLAGCSKSGDAVKPQQQVEYYRIKQVDVNGKVTYSQVKTVVINGNN